MPKRLRGYNRMIRQMPKVEKKFYDHFWEADAAIASGSTAADATWVPKVATVSLTGGAMPLYELGQGTGASERVGDKIYVHSLQMKLRMTPTIDPSVGLLAQSNQLVRVIMFVDKQANGAQPVLVSATASDHAVLGEVNSEKQVVADRNLGAVSRYRILYDRIHSLRMQSSSTSATNEQTSGEAKIISIYKRFKKPLTIRYVAGSSGGDFTEIQSNNLWCGVLCDAANTQGVFIKGNSRVRYTDA